jgi:Tfp pilus assembly protein PilO
MRNDRIWLAAGVLVSAGLVLISWFLLIAPQHSLAASYQTQTEDTQGRATVLVKRLSELRKQNTNLDSYVSELRAYQAALPTAAATADFLRSMQTIGDAKDVIVTAVAVSDPQQLSTVNSAVYQLPISVTASGTTARVESFLSDLQTVQPRAVLLVKMAVTTTSGGISVALDLRAFVASSATSTTASSANTASTPN